MTDCWNPSQYDRFARERELPYLDLLNLVRPARGMRVVDLGCGSGRLTRILHERLHARETIGIDRSARMLEAASADAVPGLSFQQGTIEAFLDGDSGRYDLIFSNAAFHWVNDHVHLIARLTSHLAPDGQLAFQVPAMHDDPSHAVAEELTEAEPFRSAFGGWHRPQPVLTADAYARVLFQSGYPSQTVRLTIYPHVLERPEAVVEWMKGTLLTEYQHHLPAPLRAPFVDAYRTRLLARLEPAAPFFFPFQRILCWAATTV